MNSSDVYRIYRYRPGDNKRTPSRVEISLALPGYNQRKWWLWKDFDGTLDLSPSLGVGARPVDEESKPNFVGESVLHFSPVW